MKVRALFFVVSVLTLSVISLIGFGYELPFYKMGDTGKLEGKKLSNLYCLYLGQSEGIFPKNVSVNWRSQLKVLWDMKLKKAKSRPVVKTASEMVVSQYPLQPTQLTFRQYKKIADEQANLLQRSIDWESIGRLKMVNQGQVNERKLELLKKISSKIGGRELLAYALTELMPGDDGEFNKNFLHFLLRNGGREYVEGIPAVYDEKTSFGPFQFTEYALYDANGEKRGASIINQALPAEHKVPGSVIKLRGDDHFKAAWLNAVENLASLIRGLDEKQLKSLEDRLPFISTEIVQYIAVSHHAPSHARRWAGQWLKEDAGKDFQSFCERNCRVYAHKTAKNYAAI